MGMISADRRPKPARAMRIGVAASAGAGPMRRGSANGGARKMKPQTRREKVAVRRRCSGRAAVRWETGSWRSWGSARNRRGESVSASIRLSIRAAIWNAPAAGRPKAKAVASRMRGKRAASIRSRIEIAVTKPPISLFSLFSLFSL